MSKYLVILLCCISAPAFAQVGLGVTYGVDFFQSYRSPENMDTISYGTGPVSSTLANFNFGLKSWVGGEKLSFSVEGQLSYAPFAFEYGDFKAMGAFSFPVIAQLQFGGLSGFAKKGGWGFSVGAGTSWSYTNVYFREDEFEEANREFYQVQFLQAGVGMGMGGYTLHLYGRYGTGDLGAANWSIGIMIDNNITHFKKLKRQGFFEQ